MKAYTPYFLCLISAFLPPALYKIFQETMLSTREFPVIFLFSFLVGFIAPTIYLVYTGTLEVSDNNEF